MTPSIVVGSATGLVDCEAEIQISGIEPGRIFSVHSAMVDGVGETWEAHARYSAAAEPSMLLADHSPLDGSFVARGTDGFFYSMTPDAPDGFQKFKEQGRPPTEPGSKRGHRLGLPELSGDEQLGVRFELRLDGKVAAEASLARSFGSDRVDISEVNAGQVRGRLFEPRHPGPHPGLVMLSGSGGGIYPQDAAVMANHGFSVLALAYFNYADLPTNQKEVPLEYFAEAFEWFRRHLGHDRIAVSGPSKGGEASLVLATHLPDYVKACVPIVPGDLYLCAADEHGQPNAAWTMGGKALPWAGTLDDWARVPEELRVPKERKLFNARKNLEPFYAAEDVYARAAIPVERIACPLLFIWGEDDQAWPSRLAIGRMLDRFAASGRSFDIESVCAPDAGHLFTFPGLPTMLCDSILHPLLPIYMTLGGTPSGTAAMQRRGWSAMIRFLHRTLAG